MPPPDGPAPDLAPDVATSGADRPGDASPSTDASDAGGAADADAHGNGDGGAQIGPLIPLPLHAPADGGVFNHSAETTIAAHAGTVVVAYISLGFDSADSFQTTLGIRGGTLAASHDQGQTFGAAVPLPGDQPTDPVVRVSRDGTFFATSWDFVSTGAVGSLQSSTDGDHWRTIAPNIPTGDKQWIAVDDAGRRVFWGALSGYYLFGFDGSSLGSLVGSGNQLLNAAYIGASALFVTIDARLARWDGASALQLRGSPLPGATGAAINVVSSTGLGPTPNGGAWLLRTIVQAGVPQVVLRLWDGTVEGDGPDVPLSPAGSYAFLPAGALDDQQRLHAVWYQDGALVWTRSRTTNLADGFLPTTVVDPAACPGSGWVPTLDTSSGGRRLREYIDVATDGPRVHIAWTHAPAAPSRVYTTTIRM